MSLAHTPAFDSETDPSYVGLCWTKWVQRFKNYTTAVNITGDARLKALLLHLAGERVHDIYESLADEGDKYADVKARLETYFTPQEEHSVSSLYVPKGSATARRKSRHILH